MDITYEELNQICRLCLSKKNSSANVLQKNLIDLLSNLGVNIKIDSGDKLPQNMCYKCKENVDNILEFIRLCKTSQGILESFLLQKTNIEYENSDTVDDISHNIEGIITTQDVEQGTLSKQVDQVNKTVDNLSNAASTNEGTLVQKTRINACDSVCEKCNIVFNNLVSLIKHFQNSEGCRPLNFNVHTCDYCSEEFISLQSKKEHESAHMNQSLLKCSYCIKEFRFQTQLHRHIYRHEVKLGLVEKNSKYKEKRVNLSLRCDECEKVFASRSGFQRHKLKHEGKELPKKALAKVDKTIKPYLCNYCGIRFYIKANLDAHLRVHTGEKPFKCNICQQQFKQKSVLDRHALNHLDIRPRPFICDVCNKSFTTRAHMEIHKRLHTGEKPYKCDFCEKCFNYRTHWRIHLRIHTGESPYVCNVCNSSYHDKGSFRKHQRKKNHFPEREPEQNKNLDCSEEQPKITMDK